VAKRRRKRTRLKLNRWLALGALALVALLYAKPVRSYLATRHEVAQRRAEVRALGAQKHALLGRLAFSTSAGALAREARRLGFVRPGEHLFIIHGVREWLRAHPGPGN